MMWTQEGADLKELAADLPNYLALGNQLCACSVPGFMWRTFLQRLQPGVRIFTNEPWLAATALRSKNVQHVSFFQRNVHPFLLQLVQESAQHECGDASCLCLKENNHNLHQTTLEHLARAIRLPWTGLAVGSFYAGQTLADHVVREGSDRYIEPECSLTPHLFLLFFFFVILF
jgi:hypothetical protein